MVCLFTFTERGKERRNNFPGTCCSRICIYLFSLFPWLENWSPIFFRTHELLQPQHHHESESSLIPLHPHSLSPTTYMIYFSHKKRNKLYQNHLTCGSSYYRVTAPTSPPAEPAAPSSLRLHLCMSINMERWCWLSVTPPSLFWYEQISIIVCQKNDHTLPQHQLPCHCKIYTAH